MGLEPLVESCTDMMLMQMGVHYEHEDVWDESDEWDDEDESDEWDDDDEESNIPDEDDEEQREG